MNRMAFRRRAFVLGGFCVHPSFLTLGVGPTGHAAESSPLGMAGGIADAVSSERTLRWALPRAMPIPPAGLTGIAARSPICDDEKPIRYFGYSDFNAEFAFGPAFLPSTNLRERH